MVLIQALLLPSHFPPHLLIVIQRKPQSLAVSLVPKPCLHANRPIQSPIRRLLRIHLPPHTTPLRRPQRIPVPPRQQIRLIRIRIQIPRERRPRVQHHLREGNIPVVPQRQAVPNDVAEDVVQLARVTLEVFQPRVAVGVGGRLGRLAGRVVGAVAGCLVGAVELVEPRAGEDGVLDAGEGGGVVEAAELGVGGEAGRSVEDGEGRVGGGKVMR